MPALQRKRGPMHEINVVPYIDVMLVLLVIFMVTAPLVTPGVVELPSVSKTANAPATPLQIVIKRDRTVIVRLPGEKGKRGEERQVSRGELASLVRRQQAMRPDMPVLIAADKNVRYEVVLNVMDELQRERIRRVGLLVKPAQ